MELVLEMDGVTVRREGRTMVEDVDWSVTDEQRWVVLGANGSGKTTLMRVASLYLHPSHGTVSVLGERFGRTDVRMLRRRIGVTSQAMADLLRPDLTALQVVETARYAALEPWWHSYTDADHERAREQLARLGVDRLAEQRFGTLSSGERQRVQLARTLMGEPELLLMDEPTAGLDLAGREDLVHRIGALASDPTMAPMVMVTHHTEEIPDSFTHVLMMKAGRVMGRGPMAEVLTEASLSECFGLALRLERRDGRWLSWSPRS